MMKFKKFLAAAMTGAMMFGMVATAAPAVSTYAGTNAKLGTSQAMVFHAAAREAETVSGSGVNYNTMTVAVSSTDPYVVVKYYKDATKLDKASNTYIYPTNGGSATIDLGFYKPGKKAAHIICYKSSDTTDTGKIAEFDLGVQADKLSLKVDTSKDTFLEALGSSKTAITSLTGYSYRSLYGTEWKSLAEFDYSTAKVAGTTIVVRKDATATQPASAEAKLKIGGMGKAPTLKITYEKDSIAVKNMEVALLKDVALQEADYKPMTDNKTFAKLAEDLGVTDLTKSFTIAVRTHKSGKTPSMPSFYTIKPAPILTASGATASTTTSGSSITVKNTSTDKKTQVQFTIVGDDKYEYQSGKSWKAITDGKDVAVTGDKITVRVAGVKAPKKAGDPEGAFPSEGKELTIPTPTPTSTPTPTP